jgi:hypothetical protein
MSRSDIVKIIHVNENTCLESYPCQHYVQVQRRNGKIEIITMSAPNLVTACDTFGYQLINKSHFNYTHITPSVNPNVNPDDLYFDAYTNGKYYSNAISHYPHLPSNSQVKCDRCDKVINICIGLGNIDLCLICVDQMNKKYYNN